MANLIYSDLPQNQLVAMGEPGDNAFYHDPTHSYWENGNRMISATGILKVCGDVDTTWYKPEHAKRGSIVHAGCHHIGLGRINWPAWEEKYPEIIPYLRAYQKFLADSCFEPKICERPHYHQNLRYGTTIDNIGKWKLSHTEIVEIKSGKMMDWTAIQTALQAMAWYPNSYFDIPRWGLELRNDETYKLARFDDPNDFNVAQCKVGSANYTISKRGWDIL